MRLVWRTPDPGLAELLQAELAGLEGEIIAAIPREVPEYARPMEGSFGRGVRRGVSEALRRFAELLADPASPAGGTREVYVELGRGEVRQGRSLESLLAAYRVGARVAWRGLSTAALEAGIEGERIAALAEAVFAYIDELSALSAEGFAAEQALRAGERQRRRERALSLLVRDPPPDPDSLARVAADAGWAVPPRLAILALGEGDPGRVAHRLAPEALGAELEGQSLVAVPAHAIGTDRLREATGEVAAALGPVVAPEQASRSLRRATAALPIALEQGPPPALLRAEEALLELLLGADPELAAELCERALEPLSAVAPARRRRLAATLAAWIDNGLAPTPTARALHMHPQSVRYRLARLREMFGKRLEDPRSRMEIRLALRIETRDSARDRG